MAAAESTPPATTESPRPTEAAETTGSTETPAASQPAIDKPAADQLDGAGSPANGNPLADTELKVEVKLADLQADPDNPLYSAKTFEELRL
jgi:ATP-dependent RNA helicase DDX19/DBP5